tara:strand:- start:1875 stop:3113 length:1239 start_codon:yes stop_codon:yes gene_type:complete
MIKSQYITKDKIIKLSVFLFGMFPLLPERIKGFPVLFLFVTSIYLTLKKGSVNYNFKEFLKLSSLYTISCLSILYTGSLCLPFNKLETSLSLIVVPISFMLLNLPKLNKSSIKILAIYFTFSTSTHTLFSLFYYYQKGVFTPDQFKVNIIRQLVTEIPFINDHPIYISIFLGISILMSIRLLKLYEPAVKGLLLVSILINIFHLLLLSSKGVTISITISGIILLFYNSNSKLLAFALAFCVLASFIASIFYFPNMERRFRELGKITTYSQLHTTNSSSIRIEIYKCAFKVIKQSPIIGYGWSKGEEKLINCYTSKYMSDKKLNSHNQFISFYLDGGIITFMTLVAFLSWQFMHAIKNKKYLYFSILILFTLEMFSENILSRQSGVILFIFLISFFRQADPLISKNNSDISLT